MKVIYLIIDDAPEGMNIIGKAYVNRQRAEQRLGRLKKQDSYLYQYAHVQRLLVDTVESGWKTPGRKRKNVSKG